MGEFRSLLWVRRAERGGGKETGGLESGVASPGRESDKEAPARTACSANTPKRTPLGKLTFLWNSDSESWRQAPPPPRAQAPIGRSRRGGGVSRESWNAAAGGGVSPLAKRNAAAECGLSGPAAWWGADAGAPG